MEDRTYIRLEHENPEHEKIVVINWMLGNTCNFKCSYCSDHFRDGSSKWVDIDIVKKFCNQVIMYHMVQNKKVCFEFTGGEVTMWKDFLELAKHLKGMGARTGIITNGSRTTRWWEEAKPYLDYVMMSYHPEFAKKDDFISVARLLADKVRVHVNIMMQPEKFNECLAVANEMVTIPDINITLQPLVLDFYNGTGSYEYTEEQQEMFRTEQKKIEATLVKTRDQFIYRGSMRKCYTTKEPEVVTTSDLALRGETNWYGWNCNIGLEQLVIHKDGNIFKSWCGVGSWVGTIFDEKIVFPKEPEVCTKTSCHCNLDITCTKFRSATITRKNAPIS